MSQTASIWIVIVLALLAANLPFVTERLFALLPLRGPKPLALRLLERRAGQIAPQGWEFYAITGTLFLTFAFPGFVWRYLYRRHA